MDQSQVSCNNCHAVTTNDGKTVWVCEQCGTENKVVDVAAAQAVVSNAAAAATPVVTPTDQPAQ
ncbi:MAG: hypothetical protein AAB697_03360 [Patescibacteria group bacterium]